MKLHTTTQRYTTRLVIALVAVGLVVPAFGTGVTSAHDSGLSLSHNKPVAAPGETYRVSVDDPAEDTNYIAVVATMTDDKTFGLTQLKPEVHVSKDGTFEFSVPEDPVRYSKYQAIIISAGRDGQFRSGAVDSLRETVEGAYDLRTNAFEQLKSNVVSELINYKETDNIHGTITFGVGSQGLDVGIPNRVVVGDDMTISGQYPGQGEGDVRVVFRYPQDDRRIVATYTEHVSDDDLNDDDTRWEFDIETDGLLVGRYNVVVYDGASATPITYRRVWVVPSAFAAGGEDEDEETTSAPRIRGQNLDRLAPSYRWASVTGLDELDTGVGRATVARVTEVEQFEHTHDGREHEHDHLLSVWLRDGAGSKFDTSYRTFISDPPSDGRHIRKGDWLFLYLVPITEEDSDESNRYIPQSSDEDVFFGLGTVKLDSSPPPMPLSTTDSLSEFLGARVTITTQITNINDRISGPDTLYLATEDGPIRATGIDGDDLAVGDNVTVAGELTTTTVSEDIIETYSPATIDTGSENDVPTLKHARVKRGARIAAPFRPRVIGLSEVSTNPTVRDAFKATVEETDGPRTGKSTATYRRALVVGEDGRKAIITYPSGIELRRGETVIAEGLMLAAPAQAEHPMTVTPYRVSIYDPERSGQTNATSEQTKSGTKNTTNADSESANGKQGSANKQGSGEEAVEAGGPGFGPLVVLSGLVLTGWVAIRRRSPD